MAFQIIFTILALVVTFPIALASDPSPLQDFCVADKMSNVFVNGFVCKDPKLATPYDFFFTGLDKPGNTMNPMGSAVTPVAVTQIAGLNTLGISLARIDFAPNGLNPPHTHPRATEILVVLEGTLSVGFVTSNPDNKLIAKVLQKGDVFVFPVGLIHFQFNSGFAPAVALSGLSSQNPGVITIANAVFGSKPPISDDILAKAFMLDKKTVDFLQSQFWGSYPYLAAATILALVINFPIALASDPSLLQDFCVADKMSNVFVNGFVCKDPKLATPNDFFFTGLDKPGNTTNLIGSAVTPVAVAQIAGLNTLEISLVRIDFAPNGLNLPHTHPRATEILVVLEGTLSVGFGFVTSNRDNKLIAKVLQKGDVFVFPVGLIHFQFNRGFAPAVDLSGLSSQNPGVITIANAVFGSKPPILDDILAKAFMLHKTRFSPVPVLGYIPVMIAL